MAKTLALVFGYVFLLVGILGFISNPIVGSTGLFHADLNHNLVHLISGIVFLVVAYTAPAKASMTLKVFGVVYLLVTALGFALAPNGPTLLGLIETNMADNYLHLALGVVILLAGIKTSNSSMVPQSM